MATDLPQFPRFDIHANEHSVGTRWTKYVQKLENMFIGMSIDNKKRRKALLLHYAGDEVFDLHDTLPETGDDGDYDKTKAALEKYFKPQVNKEFEIFEFRRMRQLESETTDQFATRLRQKAENCSFADRDAEIKSQIIQGCISVGLRRKALKENPNLDDMLLAARTMEISTRQADTMYNADNQEKTSAIKRKPAKPPGPKYNSDTRYKSKFQPGPAVQPKQQFQKKQPPKTMCRNCGGIYPHANKCPAFGKTCNYCKKKNHFVSQCRKRQWNDPSIKLVQDSDNQSPESETEEYAFGVNTLRTKRKSPRTTVCIDGHKTQLLVDTGSTINVLNESVLSQMKVKPLLIKTDTKAYAYGQNEHLPIKGKFTATVETGTKITTGTFYVISGSYDSLLSYDTAVELSIIPVINSITKSKSEKLCKDYADLFTGLGKMKDKQIKLHIDENVTPVAQSHRKLPFHVRKQVEDELDRLEKLDIIEHVDGPTPWVSPIVVAPKRNSKEIRLCVDMRKANEAIKRERHITPTVDDIIMKLNGAKVFSKIDCNSGFHQLELAPESRYITTFSTHVGLRRYKRLNFGVSSAAEIFQNEIRQTLEGLDGVINVSDDIFVFGKTQSDHEKHLESVLQRLRDRNLTLNKDKCVFSQDKLTFFGYVFSENGISADPNKVDAIKHAEKPATQSEVRSFLGMTNYVSRFIPDYSTITEPLRRLTRENEQWEWSDAQENAFQTLQSKLSSDTVIAYFDPAKETELWVDASPVGTAAILIQENKIIAYASKALSPVEQRYSQLEREALSIVTGIEHHHLYLFGQPFTLITDHNPLVSIFNSPRTKQPLRLERWRLRLATYDFKVKYRPGKSNIADYMSRHPHSSQNKHSIADEYVSYVAQNAVPKSMNTSQIADATQTDETLLKVIQSVKSGKWNKADCKTNKIYNCYSRLSDELTVTEINGKDVLLRGTRLTIPTSLQQKIIELAHVGHQGIVRTKTLLREKVWFPYIDDLVEKTCKTCIPCLSVTPTTTHEPLKISTLPARPWDEVSIDFFGPLPSGDYLMVVIDDYSHFPVVEILTTTSAKAVIPRLDNIFSMFGIPSILRSDNGPPFNGHEFSQFADYLGFKHRKICPAHPESNANAENFMKPLQRCVKIAKIEGHSYKQELNKFLRNYRATPHPSTGSPPATLMFSRNIKTALPEVCVPLNDTSIRNRDENMKQKAKLYTDKRRHAQPSNMSVGDSVLVKQKKKKKLTPTFNPEPATILSKKGSMVTVQLSGKTTTRDVSHFKPLIISKPHRGSNDAFTGKQADTTGASDQHGELDQSRGNDAKTAVSEPHGLLIQSTRNSADTGDPPTFANPEHRRRSPRFKTT